MASELKDSIEGEVREDLGEGGSLNAASTPSEGEELGRQENSQGSGSDANLVPMEKVYNEFKVKYFSELPEVGPEELREMLENERETVMVVDMRTAEEQDVSMIPGGTLRQQDFERRMNEFRDRKIVCYCTIGYRSGNYAQDLRKRGFDAANLRGSILGWAHAGLPLVDRYDASSGAADVADATSATRRVHVFSDKFALQPSNYEPVTFGARKPWGKLLWGQLHSKIPAWLGGLPR